MDLFEMIELAKQSEYGATWFSEKGPIHISKEGILKPIKMRKLPECLDWCDPTTYIKKKDEQSPETSDCKDD